MTDTLQSWLTGTLGDHDVVGPAPRTRRRRSEQPAYEIVDASGARWFLKQPREAQDWSAEVDAYLAWVPSLGGLAPSLRSSHEGLRALLTSKVPGRPPAMTDPEVQRQSGRILRQLHDAVPSREAADQATPPWHPRIPALLDADHALTDRERAFVEQEMSDLHALPRLRRVPCHGDFQRHNLLRDEESGRVRVIDFGSSRWAEPVRDLTRLYYGRWWGRPDLMQAFLAGYGRELTDLETRFLECHAAIHALQDITFGVREGYPRVARVGRERLQDLMTGRRNLSTPPENEPAAEGRLPEQAARGPVLARR